MLAKLGPLALRKLKVYLQLRRFKNMTVEDVFSTIYKENIWGGRKGEFCSGDGTLSANVAEYVKFLKEFIVDNDVHSITEIGCGDFRVSKQLINPSIEYKGLDVVKELVCYNHNTYAAENIKFMHLDATCDEIPRGEMLIIRQVLQHLSNDHISIILSKARTFKYVVITEHIPLGDKIKPNVDKKAGPDIRMSRMSGVFTNLPPFNFGTPAKSFEYREDFVLFNRSVPAVLKTEIFIQQT